MKHLIRKIHKYLSVLISIQLLLWTISGIYFAFNQIELVRGEQYRQDYKVSIDLSRVDLKVLDADNIRFIKRLDAPALVVKKDNEIQYLDLMGNPLDKLSLQEAQSIVGSSTTLRVLGAEEVLIPEPGAEYRGRPLPLYRVRSVNDEDEEINVYVAGFSGEVVAIRNEQWRIWDLMWGLHIMDWEERDDFNHWLLRVFSVLALISSVTGLFLFVRLDWK